jgi:hypothetical protein
MVPQQPPRTVVVSGRSGKSGRSRRAGMVSRSAANVAPAQVRGARVQVRAVATGVRLQKLLAELRITE